MYTLIFLRIRPQITFKYGGCQKNASTDIYWYYVGDKRHEDLVAEIDKMLLEEALQTLEKAADIFDILEYSCTPPPPSSLFHLYFINCRIYGAIYLH